MRISKEIRIPSKDSSFWGQDASNTIYMPNSDKKCSPSFGFSQTYGKIFLGQAYMEASVDDKVLAGQEDGAIVNVEIFNDTFTSSLNPSNWSLNTLATGVTIGEVNRISDTEAQIVLSGNATQPEVHYIDFVQYVEVAITSDELETTDRDLSLNIPLVEQEPIALPVVGLGLMGTKRLYS